MPDAAAPGKYPARRTVASDYSRHPVTPPLC